MRYKRVVGVIASFITVLLFMSACKESIDTSARYVFKHETILSYLEKFDVYSEYVDLMKRVEVSMLSQSSVAQLMSARGHYTCFAPTNEAIQNYL